MAKAKAAKKASQATENDETEVYKKFKELVNMSASQLEKWLKQKNQKILGGIVVMVKLSGTRWVKTL